ncbi:MAG: UvrD-helicase domain-containing protein [Myxococcales bacterium]|nr:UvrD-helicase domain-containing protein [Myxococcales bacterium]
MSLDLARLNAPQREAVVHGSGPLLVLAGAGSGKTRVITYRIAQLLERGVPPQAICALTFTNKAAEEMRERVAHLLGDRKTAAQLSMGTFHALGLTILRSERKAMRMPKGFIIYDQADQMGVLREALRNTHDIGRDGERRYDVKAILARISLAKNKFITPEAYVPRDADEYDWVTAQVYPNYQEQLRACAAFDFDDLIVEPVRLLDTPEIGARWKARFAYVMVDEYQDTNAAQLRMVKALVEQHNNLCVVGDDDQSIYSWRGADPTNILKFADMFAGAKVVKLEQNYRSTKTILGAANAVIANNSNRHGKTLWSDLTSGDAITHAVAATVEQEAQFVARELTRLHDEGRRWQDIAVMYRSNIQAKALEEELRAHSVPYVMFGGQQFFERKEVKDVIAYLRAALNPRDELAIRRIINYPGRGIGGNTLERLLARAHDRHAHLWEAVHATAQGSGRQGSLLDGATAAHDAPSKATREDLIDEEIRPATQTALAGFVGIMNQLTRDLATTDVAAAVRALIERIDLYADLRAASTSGGIAQRRIENVEGLIASLQKQQARAPGREALAQYLRNLSLQTDKDEEEQGDRVILTTLHAAKGLEFPVCFVVGLEEELLPHVRTLQPQATDIMDGDHATDVSEERRLAYVGITRAQRKLYLTRALTRVARGKAVPRTPSRFLLEIPDDLLDVRDIAEEAAQAVPTEEVKSFFAQFRFEE